MFLLVTYLLSKLLHLLLIESFFGFELVDQTSSFAVAVILLSCAMQFTLAAVHIGIQLWQPHLVKLDVNFN